MSSIKITDTLYSNWNLWIHKKKFDWTINGFDKLNTVKTIEDFWNLTNSWENNGGIQLNQFFFMRNDIHPIWEHSDNINGGCWSFKVKESQAQDLWNDLTVYLVSGNLSKDNDELNGISISKKKGGWVVIKIWNKNNSKSSLKNINYDILKKWGLEVIYISHLANK